MRKIGIIGAMDEEVDIFKEHMNIEEVRNIAGLEFSCGNINEKDIVLVRCGIGKVNAGMCAQILISEFKVDAVINSGVAGTLNDDLDVLDIVVCEDSLYHDFDTTDFGYELSVIPRMETSIFKSDEDLMSLALESSKEVLSDIKVIKGRVLTGDLFLANKELKDKLVDLFKGDCVEMESAAIMHVCNLNNVKVLVIRAISDKADGSADMTYDEFVHKAAINSKDFLINMISNMN